jgi:PhnB protein
MKMNPHVSLSFDGRCEAAFRFYEECLDGTVTFMLTWGKSPMIAGVAGWDDKIAHATLSVGDTVITGSDVPPDRYVAPGGFQLVLPMNDPVAAERVFEALAEEGHITVPLQETFWAIRFGSLVDRFGIAWSVNCEKAVKS